MDIGELVVDQVSSDPGLVEGDMRAVIRLSKWVLFGLAFAWAGYAAWGVYTISQIFPAQEPVHSDLLATVQICAVIFGPALCAGIFLAIKWPERQDSESEI